MKNVKYKFLCYYQLISGVLGIILYPISYIKAISLNLLTLFEIISFVIGLIFFSFSSICGILLLKNKFIGVKLSLLNQLMQIISFGIKGFSYAYCGLFFAGFNYTRFSGEGWNSVFNYAVNLLAFFNISYNSSIAYSIGINFVPFFISIDIIRIIYKNGKNMNDSQNVA